MRTIRWCDLRVVPALLIALPLCLPLGCGDGSDAANGQAAIDPPAFSKEVQAVIQQKTGLIEQLVAQERVVSAVRAANQENASLTEPDIRSFDARWQATEGLDETIKPYLTNDCALALVEFQETNDAFPELLVTDARGLLVAATNKSSDYLQADEPWWVEAFDEGRGRSHTGPIEYDASARSEAISIYVPILDDESGQAIGVIKAVCDVVAIKMEL